MRLEPIGPTFADHLAPGGKLADFGEALRHLDAELARLAAAGAPAAATARLDAARRDLLARLAVINGAEPRRWLIVPDEPSQ